MAKDVVLNEIQLRLTSPDDENAWSQYTDGAVDQPGGFVYSLRKEGKAKAFAVQVKRRETEGGKEVQLLPEEQSDFTSGNGQIVAERKVVVAGVPALELRIRRTRQPGELHAVVQIFQIGKLRYTVMASIFGGRDFPDKDEELGAVLRSVRRQGS